MISLINWRGAFRIGFVQTEHFGIFPIVKVVLTTLCRFTEEVILERVCQGVG